MVGVHGGFLDKIPMGSAINRGLTIGLALTPVQRYLPTLLRHIEQGEIDPSFVINHRDDGPDREERRLHQGRHAAVSRAQRAPR